MRDNVGQTRDPYLMDLVGTEPPKIEFVPFSMLLQLVANNTFQVGMCGIYGTRERFKDMDFTPPYLTTGITALVPSPGKITADDVVRARSIRSSLTTHFYLCARPPGS